MVIVENNEEEDDDDNDNDDDNDYDNYDDDDDITLQERSYVGICCMLQLTATSSCIPGTSAPVRRW